MKVCGLSGKQMGARLCRSFSMDKLVHGKSAIRIIVYHRIMDQLDTHAHPFDMELVDATEEEFDREIAYLAQNFDIITFADIIDNLDRATPLPARPLLVTLDDGFQDNYFHALPVLKKHQVPAMLFLAAGYIGNDETFWYDWLACIVMNSRADRLEYDSGRQSIRLPNSRMDRIRTFRSLIYKLGSVTNEERLAFIEEIKNRYGVVYDELEEGLKALSRPLTWEQVREMVAAGISAGSHTMTHPFLSRVSAGDLVHELGESKQLIEARTDTRVDVIAYPNGQQRDYTEEVKEAVRQAGYSLALSYVDGINPISGFDRYAMKRLHVSPRHDFSVFRMALSWPGIF